MDSQTGENAMFMEHLPVWLGDFALVLSVGANMFKLCEEFTGRPS